MRVCKHNHIQKFLNWAGTENLTPSNVLPVNKTILCNYATTFAGRTAGGTACAHISAIKGWTLHKGKAWLGGERLNAIFNGVEHRAPPSSFRNPRTPVKEAYLTFLHTNLILDGTKAADLMFFGQLHAGEVLPDSPNLPRYNPRQHPLVSDLGQPNNLGTCSLKLPSTKTAGSRGETAFITPQHSPACPLAALAEHIRVNCLGPGNPLFAYRDEVDVLRCLTRDKCVNRCNKIWGPRGIPRITGHCFRIGGTTHYLCRGVPPDVVKALGHWKLDMFLTPFPAAIPFSLVH
ncbi:hypothetical protein BT96DRAFT_960709 [Gymnopus androsaceus JB14]|uniref:Uncharacterized protein n=1 Tax=Gymnopus androsaceus JB14 TaxID=1447944 RepID=A0A6A4GJY9_9AGAR|nr:hypothetical protein BT96DRAFT_960709 [Gymnopus androsaceus JB14]